MSGINQRAIGLRRGSYVATCLTLFVGFFLLRDRIWQVANELHTLMEWVATMLALCVGALALVRFYSKKDNTFLFIGTGFVVTGLLDAYHAVVTSDYFVDIFPTSPADTVIDVDKPIIVEIIRRNQDGNGEGGEFTFQELRKNGAVVEIEGRSARMNFGGKPVLMIILLDVTERTQAEREVQILQAQLREQAIRDPLTGLYNRHFLDEAINRELARAERSGSPPSLVMGDIDNFKAINDSYGHLAGDEVLRMFGDQMKRNSRGSDIICRYGGEEFLLVLPDMLQAGAYDRAEQLRKDFADISLKHDASVIHATASFGVTRFKGHGQNSEELIAAADKALYASKYAGRNKVTAFAA